MVEKRHKETNKFPRENVHASDHGNASGDSCPTTIGGAHRKSTVRLDELSISLVPNRIMHELYEPAPLAVIKRVVERLGGVGDLPQVSRL